MQESKNQNISLNNEANLNSINSILKNFDCLQKTDKQIILKELTILIETKSLKCSQKNEDKINQTKQKGSQSTKKNFQELFQKEMNYLANIEQKICKNINQLMATQKLYHIRQNFRKLILSIFSLDNLQFYVFHDSGNIEYNNFKQNQITQIVQSNNDKRKTIQMLLANTSQTTQKVDIQKNTLFLKLFSLSNNKSQKNIHCKFCGHINKSNQKYSIIVLYKYSITNNNQFKDLSANIIETIVKISLIEIQQQSQYNIIQFYSKLMLDILSMMINNNQYSLKSKFSEVIKKLRKSSIINQQQQQQNILQLKIEKKQSIGCQTQATQTNLFRRSSEQLPSIQSFNQIMRQLGKTQKDSNIIQYSLKYQQFRYQLLERIRMYNKYLAQDNLNFMDFNQYGKLAFLALNRKDQDMNTLLNKLCLIDNLCIQKIFPNNHKIQEHIKKTLTSSSAHIINKKLYQVENGLKIRVIKNQQDQLHRIQIIMADPSDIISYDSGSTLGGAQSSTNTKRINKTNTNSDQVSLGKHRSSKNLLNALQKENPGIIQQGWLGLFIKDTQIKKKPNVMLKKKRTLFARGQQQNKSQSQKLMQEEQQQILSNFNIYSQNLNMLDLPIQYLTVFVLRVFQDLKFFERQQLDKDNFHNFLKDIQTGYNLHQNPFHNFTHGVNVMHTCFLICNLGKNQQILTPLKIFSTVLSGLCHDVGHTGRTNSFEIASKSKKALTYNDISPLQNYHASLTFEILRRPDNNFLQTFSVQEQNEIRKDIISNILYTDIKEHFPLIKKFKSIQYKPNEGKAFTNDQILTFTGMITHTSDFGGSAKQFVICSQWSKRVNIQFMTQYKLQAQFNIPQTPFFKDLDNEQIMAKNQMGFLKVIVLPLYQVLNEFYQNESTIQGLKNHIEKNIKSWEQIHLKVKQIKENIQEKPK